MKKEELAQIENKVLLAVCSKIYSTRSHKKSLEVIVGRNFREVLKRR